jgi:blue copper oxidase
VTTRSPRRWLRRVLAIALAAASVLAGVAAWAYSRHDIDTVGTLDFATTLAIPPLLDGEHRADGSVHYQLQVAPDAETLGPIEPGSRWGVNGTSPGPTLRMRTGDTVVVDVTNQLPEPTTLHWHGMHLPAIADGGPHQPIAPGATWHPTWTVDQPATTLWYHPHPHGRTRAHVQRGIAGMILVDDPLATGGSLPHRYGVDDIPVIIQDFDRHDPMGGDGLGDTIAVNGTTDPHLAVTTDRVRLRLLNASVHRQYRLGFDDHRSFRLVGTDGGLLPAPVGLTEIQLSPGERADIVVEVRPGDRPVLRSEPPELGSDWFSRRFQGGDDRFDVLQLRVASTLEALPDIALDPDAAHTIDDLGPAVDERRFELAGRRINGRSPPRAGRLRCGRERPPDGEPPQRPRRSASIWSGEATRPERTTSSSMTSAGVDMTPQPTISPGSVTFSMSTVRPRWASAVRVLVSRFLQLVQPEPRILMSMMRCLSDDAVLGVRGRG